MKIRFIEVPHLKCVPHNSTFSVVNIMYEVLDYLQDPQMAEYHGQWVTVSYYFLDVKDTNTASQYQHFPVLICAESGPRAKLPCVLHVPQHGGLVDHIESVPCVDKQYYPLHFLLMFLTEGGNCVDASLYPTPHS